MSKLDQIKADILQQNICPNLAQDATQLVMGHGSSNADIVFIGEAPGKNEDLQGVPFVGSSGRLLDEMLVSANISRSDVYITNMVKYRPPENRDPTHDEKQAFWPYLVREIEFIRPRVLVTLGRHSMQHFLPNFKIGEVHGQVFDVKVGDNIVKLLVSYHPAAAIYNQTLRATLFNDFKQVNKLIN